MEQRHGHIKYLFLSVYVIMDYLSYHVPDITLPNEDHARISGIAMDVVEDIYLKVLNAPMPIPYVHADLLRAVRTSELDLRKPREREYWNYVVGLYKEDVVQAKHPGLVLRVGKYDLQARQEDKPSWQIESRMGIKHLQLRGTDLNAVFSGVLINDPDLGVIVTPVSGLWAARKAKMGPAKGAPDAAVDLMNIVVTRAVLRALADSKKTKTTRRETVESQWTRPDTKETLAVRSIPVKKPIKIHTMAEDDVCLRFYGRKTQGNVLNVKDELLCTKNIPTLVATTK
jgi:hypothetical protein